MTDVLIKRELLERIDESAICDGTDVTISDDLFTQLVEALAAARQPEGEGLEVVAYMVGRYTTDQQESAETFALHHAGGVTELCRLSDAQRVITELREEISALHTTMMAAAVEIQAHWEAHCDEEGYGPANLMHRLERGIASQYGYTAQTLVQIESERNTLLQQLAEARDEICQHSNDLTIAYMAGAADMKKQRDKLAGLLADVKADYAHAIHWEDLHATMKRIDAALAEVEK